MSIDERHHFIVEHLWRFLRAFFILSGTFIWLFSEGGLEWLIFVFYVFAVLVDQFHGFICNRLQRLLNWKEDFKDWE